MPRSTASEADQQLIADAARHGAVVTARQLERWRAQGLLAPNVRHALGRGRGNTSQPPPGAGELVAWLAGNARRFADALAIVAAEGHVILILDDVRETCKALRLAEAVDSALSLGRWANVLAVLASTEASYVSGRAQGAMIWAGHTSGLAAAKSAAELLNWRGRELQDVAGSVRPHEWIYSDQQDGNAGACLVTS